MSHSHDSRPAPADETTPGSSAPNGQAGAEPTPRRRGGRSTSLLGGLVWFAASYGLAILGYLAANAIASRWLGLAEYGFFIIAITTSTVVGQLSLLGAHRGGLRDAAVMGEGDQDTLAILRGAAAAATWISVPIASVAAGAVVFAVSGGSTGSRLVMGAGFACLVAFGGLQKLAANYLRGFGDIRFASLLEGRSGGALISLLQAVALGAMWLLAPGTGLPGAVLALLIGFLPPGLYASWRLHRRWRHVPRAGSLLGSLRASVSRNWRFAVNQLSGYLAGTVEIWLAGALLVAADASLYAAAQRMALLLAIPLTSVQVVFAPVAARMLASGEIPRLQRVLRTGATLAAAASSILWLPMLVLPGEVLELVYGPGFDAAALPLFLLTLGFAMVVITGLGGIVLTMSHHEGLVAAIQAVAVVLRIGLGVGAAQLAGLTGLAASAALLTAGTTLTLWWLVRSRLGLWSHVTLRPSLGAMRRTRS